MEFSYRPLVFMKKLTQLRSTDLLLAAVKTMEENEKKTFRRTPAFANRFKCFGER